MDYKGNIERGSDLKTSYIPQDTTSLRGNLRSFIQSQKVDVTLCKTILRKLDFSRALFDLTMENYSDGQKKKVLIAMSLSKPAHLFIWDEPLNYIDVMSRVQIEEVLLDMQPTLVFVEHDKRFVDTVATRTIALSCTEIC